MNLKSNMLHLKSQFKRGFTLIELLIVIAIIGILAALLITNVQGARERGRDARRKADLDAVGKALRLYYNDYQSFPSATSSGNSISCTGAGNTCAWGGAYTISGTTYMSYLPYDPSSSSASTVAYRYYRPSSDQFAIVTTLENASDPGITSAQAACSGLGINYTARDYVICAK